MVPGESSHKPSALSAVPRSVHRKKMHNKAQKKIKFRRETDVKQYDPSRARRHDGFTPGAGSIRALPG